MNSLTTKYGKIYAFTIAIFFSLTLFFGTNTFYPEPDYKKIIGLEPSYPIQHESMTKEDRIAYQTSLKKYELEQDAYYERRDNEQSKYEGRVLIFFAPICLIFMFLAFRYKDLPPPIRLGIFGGPVISLLFKLLPYLGSVWSGARFLVALSVFLLLIIAGTPALREKFKFKFKE